MIFQKESLHQFLENATRLFPDRFAVELPEHGAITYMAFSSLSDRL